MKKSLSTVLALSLLGMAAGAAQAKVSAAEAAKLGTTLTCTGAEKAGNADGSIPAFSGKWLGAPDGVSYKNNVGQHIADPYASEQPKFVITAANMAQYAKFLTDGQEKMFKKYPNTFKIPVYPTHRDFRLDDSHCEATKKAATSTELSANGLDAAGGIYGSVPFPLPKTGMEVLYNAMTARRSFTSTVDRDTAVVSPNGNKFWSQSKFTSWTPANNPANFGKPVDKAANEGIAAFVLAAASIYGKRVSASVDPLVMTGWQLLIGGVVLTVGGMAFGGRMEGLGLKSGGLLLYMALLSSVAFAVWSLLLKYNPVGMIAAFNFLVPVFGVGLSAIFLGESLMHRANLAALVLVSIGIWLVTKSSRASRPAATPLIGAQTVEVAPGRAPCGPPP